MPLPSPRTTARACRARVLRRERRPEAKLACGRPERPSDGTAMRRGCAVLMAPLLAPLGAVQTHSWRGRVYQRLSPVCRAEKHTVRFDRQRPVRCRHVVDPRHCPRPIPAPWTLTRPTAARTRNGHERILAGPSAKLMGQVHAFDQGSAFVMCSQTEFTNEASFVWFVCLFASITSVTGSFVNGPLL